ncbi:MAG: NUDIX domain-containing protein [Lachnospiraceae bacterium]|nr:NUDIX domain-containing protein [Lachnospiraceae bacterium]
MELWDAYDKDLRKIEGMTLVRGEEKSIPEGVYHLVVLILVRHVDGQYLLMRRSPGKAYPLYWEATAGGSVLQGETAFEGALRELREETGIVTDDLEEKEHSVSTTNHSAYFVYVCVTDCDKDSIVLQEGETCDYKWADGKEILAMGDDELLAQTTIKYVV